MTLPWASLVFAAGLLLRFHPSHTVETFWLKASPQVLTTSQRVRLLCHVPRSDDNRALAMGVEGEASSTIPLEGASAMQTHERWFGPLPSGELTAFCRVLGSADETRWQTTLPLVVQEQ